MATEGGESFVPSAVKPKKLLALLIINANRCVPLSAMENELWGPTPPRSATNTVQTYIMQIRRRLDSALAGRGGPSAKDVLVTEATGYQLSVEPQDLDVTRYENLVAKGEAALAGQDYHRAACLFADALDVWRDDALSDVRHGPMLETYVGELEDSRTTAVERRIEAELQLGQHYGVLRELTGLCTKHPFNENLQSQLMLALHRSGRRARALAVYQQLRQRLINDLGIEPSLRLRELHRAVLNGDPSLEFDFRLTSTLHGCSLRSSRQRDGCGA
ncbi:BTAD domain-containing putative transcriptional regulator, partial [Streptomyces sp. NPDC057545]|uniref:AfsR/SARP family transcriptional regulator n=1 Tax=Streptomyces sp. NPDC057545 TaxID=3346164 RepID=UPI0036A3A85B